MKSCIVLLTVVAVALAACSSSDSSSSSSSSSSTSGGTGSCSEVATTSPTFSAYCTVQAKTDLLVLRPDPPLGWLGQKTCIPAGSPVYLASDGRGGLEGFTFLDGGAVPANLRAMGAETKLVAGTHYDGTCPPVIGVEPPKVVLSDANVYAARELSGTPCKLVAGTELPQLSFSTEEPNLVSVSWPAAQATCGFDRGYTNELALATLIKK